MDLLRILSSQKEEVESFNPKAFISRQEEKDLNLDSTLAQVVIGVRRSGKSTLCQKVLAESKVNYAYVNFDDENLVDLKKTQLDEVLEVLYRIYGKFTHLMLDEVQNIDGWPLFVNRLLRQGMKLVITGSNANLLSGELSTHLTGRYNQITLYPFSFLEFCDAKAVDIDKFSTKAIALRLRALDEYLIKGGFPETINENDSRMYARLLFDAIITKDICTRYKVRYKSTLMDMANEVLDRFCQEVSYNDFSKQYQINSIHTAKSYMSYFCNAFLVDTLSKYSFKTKVRQVSRKYYAIDNAFISGHNDTLSTESFGWRLENVIAIELRRRTKRLLKDIFYLKKNKDFEVDFVVVDRNQVEELIQVTYDFSSPSVKLSNREIGGLIKGARLTGCGKLTLIMMNGDAGVINVDGFVVHKYRAVDWLLKNTED